MLLEEGMAINFDAPDVVADPRPTYERIRAVGPVVKNDLLGVWMAVGYDEVMEALHAPERFSSHGFSSNRAAFDGDVMFHSKNMISQDPPDHTRLRNVAREAFMRRSLRRFETTVAEVVTSLLDSSEHATWAPGQELEVMASYARMVPATVIALLLGTPVEDINQFVAWSDTLSGALDSGQGSGPEWEQVRAAADAASEAVQTYLREQVEDHRKHKRNDLINDLLEGNESGDLEPDEIVATLYLLLIAGNETTTKLIGVALRMLGESPELRQRLVADPSLIPEAVEEFLRFEGVAALLPRIVVEDTELGGAQLKAGELLVLLIGAANRDPKQFENPNTFDIDRKMNQQHVAFGHGVHFCLGNSLARMEARLAIAGWLGRFPEYSVKDYTYAPAFLARGLQTLTLVKG